MMKAVILMFFCSAAVQSPSAAIWHDITGLRLLSGSDSCSGTPEVLHGSLWKSLCHKELDYRNAMVMCRQLDCGNIVSVAHKPASVENTASVEKINVNCKGNEANLSACSVTYFERCDNYIPSVINCSDSVRLVGGAGFCSGRVEIKSHQFWSTVCESDFDWRDAEVVCRELGCGNPLALQGAPYGKGKGPVGTKEFRCEGSESRLSNCSASSRDKQTCTQTSAVGLTCSEPDIVKLVGGSSKCAGMIEMFYKEQWRKVTAFDWSLKMSDSICRQLDCGSVISTARRAINDTTSSVYVHGFESALRECQISEKKTSTKGLEVMCSDSVRLVGGAGFCSGRVEIKSHQFWSTVCESDFDWRDAEVVCRELGCGNPLALQGALYGKGKGPVGTKEFRCEGSESRLSNCPASSRDKQTCTQTSAVGLTCSELNNVRLVGGSSKCDGVLEMFYEETWRKLSYFRIMETSSLVCRQLDCGSVISSVFRTVEDRTLGIYVECQGNEPSLRECELPSGDFFGYSREVICSDSVRLVGGAGFCSGRVEIKSHQFWSTVCESDFDWRDAEVVCRELGCGNPLALQGALYGKGKGPVGTKEFRCEGSESRLSNCSASSRDKQTCTQTSAVGLTCSKFNSVRLKNGRYAGLNVNSVKQKTSKCAGFIELYYQQQWWPVSSIRRAEAELICRQLDCASVVAFLNMDYQYEKSIGIQCDGSESELNECYFTLRDHADKRGFIICSELLKQPSVSFSSVSVSWDPQEQHVFRGQNFTISCSVDPEYPEGTVYLTVPWSNRSHAYPAVNHLASFFFSFSAANDSHQGNYSCIHQHQINFSDFIKKNKPFGNYFVPVFHTFSSQSEPLSLVVTDSFLAVELIRIALIPVYFLTFWFIFHFFKKWGDLFFTHTSEHKKPARVHYENTEIMSLHRCAGHSQE